MEPAEQRVNSVKMAVVFIFAIENNLPYCAADVKGMSEGRSFNLFRLFFFFLKKDR